MTEVERLTDFVVSARFGHLSEEAADQLKIRLGSLGCAIGVLDAEPFGIADTASMRAKHRSNECNGIQSDGISRERATRLRSRRKTHLRRPFRRSSKLRMR